MEMTLVQSLSCVFVAGFACAVIWLSDPQRLEEFSRMYLTHGSGDPKTASLGLVMLRLITTLFSLLSLFLLAQTLGWIPHS